MNESPVKDVQMNHRRSGLIAGGRMLTMFSAVFLSTCSCGRPNVHNQASIAIVGVHSVVLTWNPSVSPGVGYRVYRGLSSGGPYTLLNSEPISETKYTDATVQNGVTYFYTIKAVDGNGIESSFSNQTVAVIPGGESTAR